MRAQVRHFDSATLAEPADPREREAWFRRLPESAQQEFRGQWREQRALSEIQCQRRQEWLVRTLLEGMVVVLGVEWMMYGLAWWHLPVLLVIGAGVGAVWHFWAPGRLRSAGVALLGFGLVRLIRGTGGVLGIFPAMISIMLLVMLATVLALPRATERIGA